MKFKIPAFLVIVLLICSAVIFLISPASTITLASKGRAKAVIVLGPDATQPERYAASQLAEYLKKITGAQFKISTSSTSKDCRIFVGQTAVTKKRVGSFNWSSLRRDGILIKTIGNDLVLSGDRPRGTMYAVNTFLEDQLGVKWWTSDTEYVPVKRELSISNLNTAYTPKLRCRETYYARVMQKDAEFPIRMKLNGHFEQIPKEKGGHYTILGFCHTFYQLLPPEKYFKAHPEWYSEVGGKRVASNQYPSDANAQLCLTNEEMKKELVAQALLWIKKNPEAGIISIAQNDWGGACMCENCKALVARTGSQSGALITFVNSVAEEIEKQYPDFLVETLAYQYTRKAPTNARPRDNVLIRLCSIECDFAHPMTAKSNESFYKDLQDWKKISKLMYVWDYTVNFSNLLIPHPNFHVLGDNLRTFVDNNAIGMFEQGDGFNPDAAFASLKTWMISKLMWNPQLDEKKLIKEFLEGYYGKAGPYLAEYMDVMEKAVTEQKAYMGCFIRKPAFYNATYLTQANVAMQKALDSVKDNPVLLKRVRIQNLALEHLLIITKRSFAMKKTSVPGIDWQNTANDYLKLSDETGNVFIGEGSKMDDSYRSSLIAQAASTVVFHEPQPPASCANLSANDWIDIQEDRFSLAGEGEWVNVMGDPTSSNGLAAVMPGSTNQWAVQVPLQTSDAITPVVEVKASVKVKAKANSGPAFTFGIYDTVKGHDVATLGVTLNKITDDQYHEYNLGKVEIKPGMSVYLAPPKNGDLVDTVSVDRIYLTAVK